MPEGQVFFNYAVSVATLAYTADASADIDANGSNQIWGYVHEDPSAKVVAGTLSCTGAYDLVAKTATITNTVGPCGAGFGQSEF